MGRRPTISIDRETYDQMQAYTEQYSISLSSLVSRMWRLYRDLDRARQTGIFPEPPREALDEPLETFLEEMQHQADMLDESYEGDEPITPESERERAMAAYRELHLWLNSLDEEIRL